MSSRISRSQLESDLADAQAEVARLNEAAAAAAAASAKRESAQGPCSDPHVAWKPSRSRAKKHPELARALEKVAVNNEVLVALSDSNYARPGGMLDVWMEGVKRAGVSNALVVALDNGTAQAAAARGIASHQVSMAIPDSQKGAGSNHAVSALKFRALRPFLELGYAVLLSDVDIVTLRNPFEHLARDSDVEGLTDGWTNATAYGYNDVLDDPAMGWSRYAHSMRTFVINSGLFYIRPTPAALELIDLVVTRVENEKGWDQALFNECIFFPSRPGYRAPPVTRRILDYLLFLNSKVLFRTVRHDAQLMASLKPVMIHVNYHPDKLERMKAIVERYVNGKADALDGFPDGSQ